MILLVLLFAEGEGFRGNFSTSLVSDKRGIFWILTRID